jgi:hypothetical protein
MAYHGIQTADFHEEKSHALNCHAENNHTADCHSQESKFDSGFPRGYSCCGKPGYTQERFAKGLLLLWQTGVCHNTLKYSTSHFSLTVPLMHYLFSTFFLYEADCSVSVCHTIS